jgi:hypothetical protein
MYSSYSFSTSELDGCEWSVSRPGRALALGKGPPVLIGQEAGWAPELVCTQSLDNLLNTSVILTCEQGSCSMELVIPSY